MKYIFFSMFFLVSCSLNIPLPKQDIDVISDTYIIEAKNGFEVFFDSGANKSIGEYYKTGTVILNGSYFGFTESGIYYPAGYWEIDKKVVFISGILKQLIPVYNDPNITHFVGLSGTVMNIFENSKFKENTGTYDVAFQSGPLVLSGNILQDFGKSWHAREPHERTLLGKTKTGKIYFFIFIKPISLGEVGAKVIQDDRFINDPITLLNLDGGPSTAFFDGKIGFRSDKRLPIIFRINQ